MVTSKKSNFFSTIPNNVLLQLLKLIKLRDLTYFDSSCKEFRRRVKELLWDNALSLSVDKHDGDSARITLGMDHAVFDACFEAECELTWIAWSKVDTSLFGLFRRLTNLRSVCIAGNAEIWQNLRFNSFSALPASIETLQINFCELNPVALSRIGNRCKRLRRFSHIVTTEPRSLPRIPMLVELNQLEDLMQIKVQHYFNFSALNIIINFLPCSGV